MQTSSVTTERIIQSPSSTLSSASIGKKDKKKIREERRKVSEKRAPLLERVRNTRLGFAPKDNQNELCIKDDDENDDDEDDDEEEELYEEIESNHILQHQFRSMCELRVEGVPELSRTDFRRSVCETDLNQVVQKNNDKFTNNRNDDNEEEKKIYDDEKEDELKKLKHRSKSQSRLPYVGQAEDKFVLFGFKLNESPKPSRRRRWRKSKDVLCSKANNNEETMIKEREKNGKESSSSSSMKATTITSSSSRFDSLTPSSCLAAKFRAIQNR